MKFNRKQSIQVNLSPKRALVIYGPRRIGKTTMLQQYLRRQKNYFYTTGDDFKIRELFKSQDRDRILDMAGQYEIIALDEAQNIPSVGLGAKMIVDSLPDKIVILTGSSSLNLSKEVGEPLTGRHFTITLLPFAQDEIQASRFELENALEDFLVYGSYPEVLAEPNRERKAKILNELASSYLFKDVLALDKIRSPDLLLDIIKCLSFQVGSEVSLNEIANTVKTDVKTVGRYIDVLEKMFILKKIRGFSRNLRNEISQKAKYYFLDNGLRNAVISQFNPLNLRNDVGQLWENFVFMELVKKSNNAGRLDQYYFWRTHGGQEVDIIRESNGQLSAIECKWSETKGNAPILWRRTYPESDYMVVSRKNYLQILLR